MSDDVSYDEALTNHKVPYSVGGASRIRLMVRLARYAWAVLVYNLAVIAWGA